LITPSATTKDLLAALIAAKEDTNYDRGLS
jgi:hypothetical protein